MTDQTERERVVCGQCGKYEGMRFDGLCTDCFVDPAHLDRGDYCDDEDDGWDDCGLMPDGTCMQAGTEHCDWDCPHSH